MPEGETPVFWKVLVVSAALLGSFVSVRQESESTTEWRWPLSGPSEAIFCKAILTKNIAIENCPMKYDEGTAERQTILLKLSQRAPQRPFEAGHGSRADRVRSLLQNNRIWNRRDRMMLVLHNQDFGMMMDRVSGSLPAVLNDDLRKGTTSGSRNGGLRRCGRVEQQAPFYKDVGSKLGTRSPVLLKGNPNQSHRDKGKESGRKGGNRGVVANHEAREAIADRVVDRSEVGSTLLRGLLVILCLGLLIGYAAFKLP